MAPLIGQFVPKLLLGQTRCFDGAEERDGNIAVVRYLNEQLTEFRDVEDVDDQHVLGADHVIRTDPVIQQEIGGFCRLGAADRYGCVLRDWGNGVVWR